MFGKTLEETHFCVIHTNKNTLLELVPIKVLLQGKAERVGSVQPGEEKVF